jgi:lactam utilization protein B
MTFASTSLLTGCAAEGTQQTQGEKYADEGYTPTGTHIRRKAPGPGDGVAVLDKEALENRRTNTTGATNRPQR